ncbi:hypothetical protein [Halostella litorea]|uniref:hypothetical protein n=1 Tax=Halostella litorea TaxID=2528831 RepID=UPI001092C5C2|nr:hypothetical protein [Halostella litorea]
MGTRSVTAVGYVVFGAVIAAIPLFLVSGPELFSPSAVLQYAGGGLLVVVGVGALLGASVLESRPTPLIAAAGAVVGVVGLLGQFLL